ncbi:MAG: TetR/AcrR family transcriptional regulator [Actinomycetota bacterium]|nr:TetR/AcrR family transcriptional regulator [Actinomycetota bacterium]
MAPRPTRPALRVRYDRRRREMVFAAAKVFATRGYDQTTMQDLARSMGLATGAVYHYFGSKEQLLISICDQLMEPLLARAREIVVDDASPTEHLRALVRLWVANVIEHRDHMLVFQQERHTIESGAQWRGVRESRKAFDRLMEHALEEAGAHGPVGADPRLAHLALLGMVNHTAQWYRPRGRFGADEIADGYLALLISAG